MCLIDWAGVVFGEYSTKSKSLWKIKSNVEYCDLFCSYL